MNLNLTKNHSPYHLFIGVFLLGLMYNLGSLSIALNQPSFGYWLLGEETHWVVRTSPSPENSKDLSIGEKIVAIQYRIDGSTKRVPWEPSPPEPDVLSSFADMAAFLEFQEQLSGILFKSSVIGLERPDGEIIWLDIRDTRSLGDLPIAFWGSALLSQLALGLGGFVFAYSRKSLASKLTFCTAVGFFITVSTNMVYTTRELAMPAEMFRFLVNYNHFGALFFSYSAMLVLAYYPKPISNKPLWLYFYLLLALVLLNEYLELSDLPVHTYHFSYLIPYVVAFYFVYRQWNLNRDDAVGRASLLWLALTFLVVCTLVLALYFVPAMFGKPPLINIWWSSATIFVIYVGIVAGIVKFRLFDIDRWWRLTWLWSIAGAAVIALDVVFLSIFHLNESMALGLSVIICGWLWLPARQKLLASLSPAKKGSEAHFNDIVRKFVAIQYELQNSDEQITKHWQNLLDEYYDVADFELEPNNRQITTIENNGLMLRTQVPTLNIDLVLHGKDQGKRLFDNTDLQFVEATYNIAMDVINTKREQDRMVHLERNRIMRDLHDDVCPLLLTLIHQNPEAVAPQEAMHRLRETIYSLDEQAERDIGALIGQLRQQIDKRFSSSDVVVKLNTSLEFDDTALGSLQFINLVRVFNESMVNILKHAHQLSRIKVDVCKETNDLEFCVVYDGHIEDPEHWIPGKGLINMETRLKEIDGHISWHKQEIQNITRFGIKLTAS